MLKVSHQIKTSIAIECCYYSNFEFSPLNIFSWFLNLFKVGSSRLAAGASFHAFNVDLLKPRTFQLCKYQQFFVLNDEIEDLGRYLLN